MVTTTPVDTTAALAWYRRNRGRSEAIFDLIDPSAYYSRPIALRNPIVFYEGHLPAFSVIAFLRRGLGLPPVDARLETLFERGIDPETEASAVPRSGASTVWPSRDEVRAFARACDEAIVRAMSALPPGPVALEGLYTALEHEAMHQETLLYMWHRLPYEQKSLPPEGGSHEMGREEATRLPHQTSWLPPSGGRISIPAGMATLGADRATTVFGWDNEFDAHQVHVPAFDVDTVPVTNAQFLEFIAAGGYTNRDLWDDEGWEWITRDRVTHPAFWIHESPELLSSCYSWRGMFEALPLPLTWPVYTSHAEAAAYARWKGRRLMTEAEWHRAAEGASPGHVDFAGFDPIPVGSHPETASVHGVHDLIGNGWEWTSTVFAPFDGFVPMTSYPEYSADFFDGRHYVMKGASPATARELVRPSFRNWFRGNYPYVYAKFRTAGDRESRSEDR
jgi:ergothioneine biosynthesis protein EgtB